MKSFLFFMAIFLPKAFSSEVSEAPKPTLSESKDKKKKASGKGFYAEWNAGIGSFQGTASVESKETLDHPPFLFNQNSVNFWDYAIGTLSMGYGKQVGIGMLRLGYDIFFEQSLWRVNLFLGAGWSPRKIDFSYLSHYNVVQSGEEGEKTYNSIAQTASLLCKENGFFLLGLRTGVNVTNNHFLFGEIGYSFHALQGSMERHGLYSFTNVVSDRNALVKAERFGVASGVYVGCGVEYYLKDCVSMSLGLSQVFLEKALFDFSNTFMSGINRKEPFLNLGIALSAPSITFGVKYFF